MFFHAIKNRRFEFSIGGKMKNHYLLLMLLLISNNLFAALDSPVIFVGPDDYAKDRVHFNIYKIQDTRYKKIAVLMILLKSVTS